MDVLLIATTMLLSPSHSQLAALTLMLFHPLLADVKVVVPLYTIVRSAFVIHVVGTEVWFVVPRYTSNVNALDVVSS